MTNCPLRVAARHACFLYSNVHSCGARKRLQYIGLGSSAITRLYLIFNIMLRCSNPSIMKGSDVA